MDALTLDQFTIFATIVDTGSFAAAARRLNRRQSAITYAVQKLEDQTGAALFDRRVYRPSLTEAGRVLLPQARRILKDIADFRRQAQSLTEGLEPEVSLLVDKFIPFAPIAQALRDFQGEFPVVRIRILTKLERPIEALIAGHARIGVFMNLMPLGMEFERAEIGAVELVAVAAPGHPLAALAGPIPPETLYDHIQIIVSQPGPGGTQQDFGVHAVNRWFVDDVETKHALLCSGLGWGSMPRTMISGDLIAGRLVELKPTHWDGADRMPKLPFAIFRHSASPLGPAGRWLYHRLGTADWPA